jgi:branched-chain amino acid transport system substrate-binding protein
MMPFVPKTRTRLFGLIMATAMSAGAQAVTDDRSVRIGVLNDQSGMYSASSGAGSVVAAQLAADDAAAAFPNLHVEIVSADHQNKPDIGAEIARRWYDRGGVDAIADVPVSSVALAVQEIARERRHIVLNQAATSDLSGRACSPFGTEWGSDTYTLSAGTARAAIQSGQKSWFFLSADYAFGKALLRDASVAVTAAGGQVLGSVAHPLNTADFSSYLLQAQASGADTIGLADAGGDMINAIKQAHEFGLSRSGQRLVGFLVYVTDIHALGLEVAQNILVTDSAYWDENDATRAFAKRFFAKQGTMPSTEQSTVYISVLHYLKAVQAAGSKEAESVAAAMRKIPVDYFGRPASIREDGRVVFDLTLYAVKAPGESRGPWDYYRKLADIPKGDAFRPLTEGDCPLVRK